MPDEDADDISPWLRDDWVADTSVIGAEASAPSSVAPEPAPRRSRAILGVGVIAVIVLAGAALLRSTDDDPDAATTSDPSVAGASDGSIAFQGPAPSASSSASIPTTAVVVLSNTVAPPGPGGVVARVSPAVAGAPPAWAESTIIVPEALVAMAPTQVVTLSAAGVLTITEFPTGRTRSVDVSDIGANPQLAIGDGTIVVFGSTELLRIRDGEPVVRTSLSDGIIFVQPWTGTQRFLVTSPSSGPTTPEQTWALEPDGELNLLDDLLPDADSVFTRMFSPFGDLLVSEPGGVYAIDLAGAVRRMSTGDLLAAGPRHYAIEECDDQLRCAYSIVDWFTGAVNAGMLDSVSRGGSVDPTSRISPDGRSVVYRDTTTALGGRRILDVGTGASVDAGTLENLVMPDAWAADSSGLFLANDVLQFVDRTTGTVTDVDVGGRIVAVGTFVPAASG